MDQFVHREALPQVRSKYGFGKHLIRPSPNVSVDSEKLPLMLRKVLGLLLMMESLCRFAK